MSRSLSAGWPAMPRVYQTLPCATELLEQPLGAESRVLDLVVVQVVGVGVGDVGVDRDGRDAGCLGLVERRVERVGVVRVEDDRVHVSRDQVADVLELAGRIGVAMDGGQLGDLAGGERLGLGRADLLLAEAVADAAAVRIADVVRPQPRCGALARGGAGRLARGGARPPRSGRRWRSGALDAPPPLHAHREQARWPARPPSRLTRDVA